MLPSLILFVTLIACSFGQSRRCGSTPVPQWYGELHESNHESMNPMEPVIRTAYIFYDATNERFNITERELIEPGDRTRRVTELYLHKVTPPMKYSVDLTTGECTSERLEYPFRPFGVPSNASFHGIDYLGAEITGLGLLVDSFSEHSENGGDYHGFWAPSSETSRATCVPIIETYRNREGPIPRRTNIHTTFRNINIVSLTKPFPPETFIVPAECRQ